MLDGASNRLDSIWATLHGEKGDLIERSQAYAAWTVPSVCPYEFQNSSEQIKGSVAVGARLVNHLSHRIADTMFPNDRPFFALSYTPEAEEKLTEEMDEASATAFMTELRNALSRMENAAMRNMNLTAYRPVAVQAIMHQIVTGNAVILRTPTGERVVYGVQDFCTRRDVKGNLLEVILKDNKQFSTLPEHVQADVLAQGNGKRYKPDTKCILYTHFKKEGNRWVQRQAIDDIEIGELIQYKQEDFPVISLTWNLSRGEDYGRGLVEDHAVTFHNIDITTKALIDLVAIAADVVFLVDPSSTLDVEDFNNAPRGSYLPGRDGDVTTPQFNIQADMQILNTFINEWSRELSQSFLLSSAGVRDAERVTAEEIRFYAREIESAFGGLYSKLALNWQQQEAEYLVSQLNFSLYSSNIKAFEVVVTSGLESLSREGQIDMLRLAVSDLQMLQAVPPEVLQHIDKGRFAEYIFRNRGLNLADFIKSEEQVAQEQQAMMQQEAQMQQDQMNQQVAAQAASQ